jgi:hypothetical protein
MFNRGGMPVVESVLFLSEHHVLFFVPTKCNLHTGIGGIESDRCIRTIAAWCT